jgi:hypothetical protein
MLEFDLLAIIPSSFSRVLFFYRFSEKSSKIKFLKKFQKNLFKFFMSKMGQRGTWETSGGPATPPHHLGARPSPGRTHLW